MSPLKTDASKIYTGLCLISHTGEILFSLGSGTVTEIRTALQPSIQRWLHGDQAPAVLALTTEHELIAVCAELHDRLLILLKPASDASALQDFLFSVPFAPAVLNHFLTSSHDAISVVDAQGVLQYISPTHEKWLGLKRGEALGRLAQDVIPNSRMSEVALSGKAEIGHPYTADGGATRIVSRIPIFQDHQVVGVIGRTLFKGPEALQRMYEEISRLQAEVKKYREHLGQLREEHESLTPLVGHSAPMQALKQEIEMVAQLDVPVLIVGESGTGKELVAKALHALSPRKSNQLVSMNLAALPMSLIESELFGYAPGSFTGSNRGGRVGKFELSDKSTFFLDEVGDIPSEIQVKLLRVLEDHVVERLGENRTRKVDFRLIAATHRKMDELVESGAFRLDLYYRIAGVTLYVPSLSERLEDIPELLDHFVRLFCLRNNWPIPSIESEVPTYLAQLSWPGNIRQLRQKIEEALVFSSGKTLSIKHFTRRSVNLTPPRAPGRPEIAEQAKFVRLREMERQAAADAVRHHGGNKSKAASSLGISRSHLYRLLEQKQGSERGGSSDG